MPLSAPKLCLSPSAMHYHPGRRRRPNRICVKVMQYPFIRLGTIPKCTVGAVAHIFAAFGRWLFNNRITNAISASSQPMLSPTSIISVAKLLLKTWVRCRLLIRLNRCHNSAGSKSLTTVEVVSID